MKSLKVMKFAALSCAVLGLAACGSTTAKEAKLVASFISPAHLTYQNMRPSYNYYLTTYDFEVLDVYDDNTYCLTLSSSTFSALILPETGNDAQGNERDNSLYKYYGTFTSKQDELDPNTYEYTISAATRLVATTDAGWYIDTDNWTEDMKKKAVDVQYGYDPATETQTIVGKTEYATGAEYLAAHNINETVLTVNIGSYTLDYKAVK